MKHHGADVERLMRILITGDDLGRVRLSPTVDPFEELQNAARSVRSQSAPLKGWVTQTATRLGPAGATIIEELCSPLVQFTGIGIKPDGLNPFDVQLDKALSQPTSQWQAHSAELHRFGLPFDPDLSDGTPVAVNALGKTLQTFYDAAIAPHWAAMSGAGSAAVRTWGRIMSQSGVEGLLRSLHVTARWSPPALELNFSEPDPSDCDPPYISDTSGLNLRVSERGLMIVPSVFRRACAPLVVIDSSRGPVVELLTVPIPVIRTLFTDHPGDHHSDPVAHLLGATRSWVLLACATGELTTSELAHVVGISVSSASEHTSVLRAAGLITSHRDGNLVLHCPTPTGLALLRSANRPARSKAERTAT